MGDRLIKRKDVAGNKYSFEDSLITYMKIFGILLFFRDVINRGFLRQCAS